MSLPHATPSLSPPLQRRLRLPHGVALWLQGSIVLSFLAASTVPSPMYAMYRAMWGFSPLTLTLVFASYAFALLAALLVLGSLSDHLGRRPLTLAALGLELVGMVLFHQADSVGWLFAARIVQGVATGIVMSAAAASLLDLHPGHGALMNSLAPMIGMAAGALGAAALVQWGDQPTRTVYDLLIAVFVVQTVLAAFLPETAPRRPGAWASLRPSVDIPPSTAATLLLIAPVNTALWALGGFVLSLGPTLARDLSGIASPLLGGALISGMVLSAATATLLMRSRESGRALKLGASLLVVGLLCLGLSVVTKVVAALFLGCVVAGFGFGASLNGSVRSLVAVTPPHARGGMMSAFYVLCYLAFGVPAIGAGLAVGWFGLFPTATGYLAVLTVLAALVAWRAR